MVRKRVDKLLVDRGLASTRARARVMIEAGEVFCRGFRVDKVATQLSEDAHIELKPVQRSWVSRGAFKLLRGLDVFGVAVEGRVCLDVGASTGGFTEVLLDRGASLVYSVDVGYGQLAWQLRNDSRVVVMERTNARYLEPEQFPDVPDLVVTDASFISLKLLLPAMEKVCSPDGEMILLVKPQFEAGRERLGSGGVVRNPLVHRQILDEMLDFVARETRFTVAGVSYSPIRGPKGNIEFLFHLKASSDSCSLPDLGGIISEAHQQTGGHS